MSEGLNLQIPEAGPMRDIVRYMAVQARIQIAERNFEAAIRSLQTGFAMTDHVADGSTLIINLVGIAMGDVAVKRVEELIQTPGAPNLYWALTGLPHPFIDVRKSMEQESRFLYLVFPSLADLETKTLTQSQYQSVIKEIAQIAETMMTDPVPAGGNDPDEIAKADYPEAKQYLLTHGKTLKQIEALPDYQAVLLYHVRMYEQGRGYGCENAQANMVLSYGVRHMATGFHFGW